MGVSSLLKTVTRQRRDCDLNPGPSAPESSTLTIRLLSRPLVKYYTDITVRNVHCLTATETHMLCGITQCYLPPVRTPAEAGTRLSDPGGMQG